METKSKTINGVAFEIRAPYAEGHVLTAAEAKALNQTRAENIGNNLRTKIKEAQEAGKTEAELAAIVEELDASYTFTLASVGASRKLDPYEREAVALARGLLRDHLAKTGRNLTKAPEGETEESWADKIEAEVERISTSEAVVKQAKKNVDAKKKAADSIMESIGGVAV